MMRRRVWFLLAALAVVVAVVTILIPWGETPSSPAAESFLDAYVEPDGRVVRRDEGGDTVSEGQAYALLLAAAIGGDPTFDRVWMWTTERRRRARRRDRISFLFEDQGLEILVEESVAHGHVISTGDGGRATVRLDRSKCNRATLA